MKEKKDRVDDALHATRAAVEHFIFGKDGGKNIASKFNIELLAQIPINIEIQKKSDEGTPFLEVYKNNSICKVFEQMTKNIIKNI